LIAAEDVADRLAGTGERSELVDLDLDGRDEVLLTHPGQVVTVDLDEGAGIAGWDLRAPRHALTAVMRRRPEAYHATLREHERQQAAATARATGVASSAATDTTAPASIHDIVRAKESNLSDLLHYDAYERRSGLVHFFAPATTPQAFADAQAVELGDFLDDPFLLVALDRGRLVTARDGHLNSSNGPSGVHVEKRLILGGDRMAPSLGLEVVVENRSGVAIEALLGVEWATTMLGGGGNPAAWYDAGDERVRHDSSGAASAIARIGQGNDYVGVAVATTLSPAADAWWSPIETVSNSEAGFERVYQGSALLFTWPLRLGAGKRMSVRVDHVVSATRDRAAEEAATARSGA
jgi:alpha-amylase